jgi:hypothetical protein
MLELLFDNMFVISGGRIFQQIDAVPMDANCAPLPADLFLYSYEADFMRGLVKKNEEKLS